jgi:glutamine amidotransferase-like uncharacterized protein
MHKIAIYCGPGVSFNHTIENIWKKLEVDFDIITPEEIETKLNSYNLLVIPGGTGNKICKALGSNGRNFIREWVFYSGKNVLGVCAGAYAIANGFEYSLGFNDYELANRPYWRRGEHTINLKVTDAGKSFFNIDTDILTDINYHNGPIYHKMEAKFKWHSESEILLQFQNEILAEGSDKEVMNNSPAATKVKYGKGMVVAISPHIEKHDIYKSIITNLMIKLSSS